MAKYRKKPISMECVQWNKPEPKEGFEYGLPKWARECNDHSRVRSTSYMEVNKLLGTSGCSREEPYWDWTVLGVIDTIEGQHIVTPGDWIITGVEGECWAIKDSIFKATYEKVEEE